MGLKIAWELGVPVSLVSHLGCLVLYAWSRTPVGLLQRPGFMLGRPETGRHRPSVLSFKQTFSNFVLTSMHNNELYHFFWFQVRPGLRLPMQPGHHPKIRLGVQQHKQQWLRVSTCRPRHVLQVHLVLVVSISPDWRQSFPSDVPERTPTVSLVGRLPRLIVFIVSLSYFPDLTARGKNGLDATNSAAHCWCMYLLQVKMFLQLSFVSFSSVVQMCLHFIYWQIVQGRAQLISPNFFVLFCCAVSHKLCPLATKNVALGAVSE